MVGVTLALVVAVALHGGLVRGAVVVCDILPSHLSVDYLPASIPSGADEGSFLSRVTDTATPLLGWWIDDVTPSATPRNLTQSAYRIIVATSVALLNAPDVWDSGQIASRESVSLPYGGPLLAAGARVFWRVSIWDASGQACGAGAETGAWEVPLLTEVDWKGAKWLTRDAPTPTATNSCVLFADDAAPLFRAAFTLSPPGGATLIRARLSVAGLGYFLPFFDGVRVGDEELAPAWTDFNKTVYFSTYDVTPALRKRIGSTHAIGIAAGNGYWNLAPLLFWGQTEMRTFLPTGVPMIRALLTIHYSDGSSQVLTTAPTSQWSVGASEIAFNSVYLGTRVDRRKEPVGWSTATFDASAWPAPFAAPPPPGELRSPLAPPVRRQPPRSVVRLASQPNEVTLDIGKQTAGVCNLCFAPGVLPGAGINFRYGELLFANGSVNGLTSVAGQIKGGGGGDCAPETAFQEDHYTFRGDAAGECFEPIFTWHAGRYIMLTGDAGALAALDTSNSACYPLRTDVALTGSVASSSDTLNAVLDASVNTAECNLMSIQTDCPHRERFGYGGDALMSGESLLQTFDLATFYEKRIEDFVRAQRLDAGITETAPFVGISDASVTDGSGPIGWQAFLPAGAMWLYKYHGNVRALQNAYAAATHHAEYLVTAPMDAIENGLGDWMALEDKALSLTGRAFQYISFVEYANMSRVLGNASQAARFDAFATAAAEAINAKFLDAATGVYSQKGVWNATQCGQAMPLFLGIVPAASRDAAVRILVNSVMATKSHFAVGAFGIKYLLMALSESGNADAAADLMLARDYPSFGYMLDGAANNLTNATTIWESWYTSNDSYSHNHPMFTSGVHWAYQALVGITPHPAASAYDRIIFKPSPPTSGSITWANGTVQTRRGIVTAAWTLKNKKDFQYTVCLPPGIDSQLWLPSGKKMEIQGTCCGCMFEDTL